MSLRRTLMVVGLAISFLAAPALRASADDGEFAREPSAAKKHTKKKDKKKKKKMVGSGHAKRAAKLRKRAEAKGGSHYPTQPGGSGFADIPNEKKDDLPPPVTDEPK